MAERVAASIVIGGSLSQADYAALVRIASSDRLSTEWGGERFEAHHLPADGGLALYGNEIAWGRFDQLETFCRNRHLPFVRWSGSSGGWGAERVVFIGKGDPTSFAVDDDDQLVIARDDAEKLGSFEAIMAHFAAAEFVVPPFVVEDVGAPEPGDLSGAALVPDELNSFQRTCAAVYGDGDFAHVESVDAARGAGDTLFAFLMIELSTSEGCESQLEAVRRLEMALSQIDSVIDRIASGASAETPIVSEHGYTPCA